MVSTTICLNSPVYLLFGIPFGIMIAPHSLVQVYHTCLTNGVQFNTGGGSFGAFSDLFRSLKRPPRGLEPSSFPRGGVFRFGPSDGERSTAAVEAPYHVVHEVEGFLHFRHQLELGAAAVEVVALPVDFEVGVALQMVGEEADAAFQRCPVGSKRMR